MKVDYGSESILYLQMMHLLRQTFSIVKGNVRRRELYKKNGWMGYGGGQRKCYRMDWEEPCSIEDNPLLIPAMALSKLDCITIKRNRGKSYFNGGDVLPGHTTSANIYVRRKGERFVVNSMETKEFIQRVFYKDMGIIIT
jgi:hypothetical protein